ncbi:hypothetical protein ABER75_12010 [Niallia taxi]|uniref:hypothetical protein n=1 Tax=Niallia taxi TaxID=2499688 RepID=UPI003D2CA3BE
MGQIIPFKPKYQVVEFADPKEKRDARTKELLQEYEELKERIEKRKAKFFMFK